MAAPFDNIVQHLFHQPSLHSVTVDELQHMTQEHPYFAAAHFLLLKKMQDTEHPSFTDQLHRTTLYFNNPLWLQFLLQPETAGHFTVSDKAPFIENEPGKEQEENIEPDNNAGETGTAALVAEDRNEFSNGSAVQHEQRPQGNIMDVITEVFREPDALRQETNIAIISDDYTTEETNEQPAEHSEGEVKTDAGDTDSQHLPATDTLSVEAKHEQPVENTIDESNSASVEAMEIIPIAEPEKAAEEQNMADSEKESSVLDAGAENIEPVVAEQEIPQHEQAVVTDAGDHDATEMPESMNAAGAGMETGATDEKPLLKTIIETPGAKNDLLFEPYHTVDYFASQGIKLGKQETDPKDKLGRQLKSFTDWLKTMKKLPQVSIDKILAENEESKVVEDAIHSIENKEVITEAMAEVFEKQGMHEKAAGIYQKLSLLNPSKSAYFAARIEALKH